MAHLCRGALGPLPATMTVDLSEESIELLQQLADLGRFGRSPSEVAARFIDKALEQFIEAPRLKIGSKKSR